MKVGKEKLQAKQETQIEAIKTEQKAKHKAEIEVLKGGIQEEMLK